MSVHEKMEAARDLYTGFSSDLYELPGFAPLLEDYRREIRRSGQVMQELGLPRICTHCAVHIPGGGCCGPDIAGWYDTLTLLLNLFFRVDLPSTAFYPDSCLFLGRNGCVLEARYHFCVNYLCSRITSSLEERELERLRSQSGRELYAAWRLEGIMTEFFLSRGISPGKIE